MHAEICSRIGRLSPSPTLEIHQKVREFREQGRQVIHLGFGESPFPPPPPLVEALKKHAGDTRYLPPQGFPALRKQAAAYLSRRFGHATHPDRIVIGPGSKELIFDALLALKGEVILPAPCWVSYAPQAKVLGKRVIWAPTDPAAEYRMTGDDLDRACRESQTSQKILFLNSPCNPTGAVCSESELKDLAKVCRRHNVIVISDEIYAEIVFGQRKSLSIAAYYPERTLVTTGLSKGFSAGGYRLGVLAIPEKMTAFSSAMAAIAGATFSCVAAPIQHAAIVAFSGDKAVRAHVRDTVAIHKLAGHHLHQWILEAGLRCPRPEGTFYLFPDFLPYAAMLRKRGIRNDRALCADVLEKCAVAMLPGSAFGLPADQFTARLSTCDYDGAAVLKAFRGNRPRTRAKAKAFVERNCPNLAEAARRIRGYLEVSDTP